MNTTSLSVDNGSPSLTIRSDQDCSLVVRGQDIEDVQVSGKGAKTLEWENRDGTYHLRIQHDATVTVPRPSRVNLADCRGHVDVSDLPGGVAGDAIGGHARLGNLGSVCLQNIGGHCSVARVEQDATIGSIGGHLNVEAVGGNLSIPQVGGHAKGRDIKGHMRLGDVGGHIELRDVNRMDSLCAGGHVKLQLSALGDSDYSINAGGNIALKLPVDAGATVHMTSGIGHSVQVFGDGAAHFQLNAGGLISLSTDHRPEAHAEGQAATGGPGPLENIAQQARRHISQVIETATGRLTSVLDEQGLTSDKRADLQEQFSEIQEEAVKAAQVAMETVQTRSRTVWEQEVKPNLDFLTRESEPVPTPSVSPEAQAKERMMILRMLEEGKISVEEANQLLQALGS